MASANFDVISYNSNSYYPRDTVNYLIKGTQTTDTNVWTGPLPTGVTAYPTNASESLTVDYFLPRNSSASPVTLNLGGLGARPVYFNDSASPVGNQFPRYSVIRLAYVIDSNLNSGNGAWQVVGSSYKATNITIGSASNWNAGSTPTLGTAISADDITAWSAGSTPTLGTAIPADDITAWDAGSTPTLGTAISADDITAWSAGTMFSASVSGATLSFTDGTLPSLSYTARSIPNVTSVGTKPSLSYTAKSIPNVTSVGSVPSLTYTSRSIPNVTSVGSKPSLTITETSVVSGIEME